jgi:transposase InsO family protein
VELRSIAPLSGPPLAGYASATRSPDLIGPQTNGKAERFVQTLLCEWAYPRLYHSNEERRIAFPKWLHYYNHHRPHTALEGWEPAAVSVNDVCGNHT